MVEIILSHPVTYLFLLWVGVIAAATIYQRMNGRRRARDLHAHE
jgi:hypothetical protein